MSLTKIDSAAAELAINAAQEALANDTNLAWIRKSCLIERAYFLGLFNGLDAIAEENAIGKHLGRIFMLTYWARSADDTFRSTPLGRDFEALKTALLGLETGERLDLQVFETVIRDINLVDRAWRERLKHVHELLANTQAVASVFRPPIDEDAPERNRVNQELRQIHYHVSQLEEMLRFMALLETHHEMSKRLEDA